MGAWQYLCCSAERIAQSCSLCATVIRQFETGKKVARPKQG
jgi:hypothetical protein